MKREDLWEDALLLSANKTACLHTLSLHLSVPYLIMHTLVSMCVHTCVLGGRLLFVCLETEFLTCLLLSLARLSVQPAPRILPVCFCLPGAEIMKMCHRLGIFVWLLGVELSSLCLLATTYSRMGSSPALCSAFVIQLLGFCWVVGGVASNSFCCTGLSCGGRTSFSSGKQWVSLLPTCEIRNCTE